MSDEVDELLESLGQGDDPTAEFWRRHREGRGRIVSGEDPPGELPPIDPAEIEWLFCPNLIRPDGCGCFQCAGGPLDGTKVSFAKCRAANCAYAAGG